ncbi:MAG TPA: SDR family oxidoreductase [Candidatus Limnocylindrales bacterium]|jgi:enoyl-[acyl-carrier protein] reductase III|nr:SDR family oxidoreductase [Candidatus Limnocylindrales bacterium]
MSDDRQRWALILGASSGFGEAAALALAADGYDICGVHLDRRQGMAHVDQIRDKITGHGREALFFNGNAADDEQRAMVVAELGERLRADGGYVRVLMHSLAFGTLKPFLAMELADAISRKNMDMTLDVMAHSLVYWVQDVWRAGLFADGSKVYAMTSEGSSRVIGSYGAVSAAKSALESHCRQLAMEFAKLRAGVTVNAIRAGVTMTPALMQIPEAQELIDHATKRNPMGRMTAVDDVAQALVRLSGEGTHWITGNVIGVDGGELISG